jgi:hypothetical protein
MSRDRIQIEGVKISLTGLNLNLLIYFGWFFAASPNQKPEFFEVNFCLIMEWFMLK